MQKHTKIYIKHFGEDSVCEMCEKEPVVDVHHIQPRSSFGKKRKYLQDLIENLIGLCRVCHEKAHFQQKPYLYKPELTDKHLKNLGQQEG